jgi:hypothetical protein
LDTALLAATLIMALATALVTARQDLGAWLEACSGIVAEWMARQMARVSTLEHFAAWSLASATDLVPVLLLLNEHFAVVLGTAERNAENNSTKWLCAWVAVCGNDGGIVKHDIDDFGPKLALACKELGVAEHIKATLSSREGDADAIFNVEEADHA